MANHSFNSAMKRLCVKDVGCVGVGSTLELTASEWWRRPIHEERSNRTLKWNEALFNEVWTLMNIKSMSFDDR
jgi:hypothetical protein